MDRDLYEMAERQWVEEHEVLVGAAFDYFIERGEWPTVERAQRQLDRSSAGTDVRAALDEMPRVAGETRPYVLAQTVIPMRFLYHLDRAAQLLEACLRILTFARTFYGNADLDADLVFNNQHPDLLGATAIDVDVLLRAGELLDAEGVKPLAGGRSGSGSWQYNIIPDRVRLLPDVFSLHEFFLWQDDMYAMAARLEPRPTSWPSAVTPSGFSYAAPDDMAEDLWGVGTVRLFLSHLAVEKVFVAAVDAELERWGIRGFVAHDSIEPSREWQVEIERALRTADALVGFIHEGFRASSWTQQKVGWAYGRGIPTLMVRLAGEDPAGFVGRFQAPRPSNSPKDVATAIVVWLTTEPGLGPKVVDALLGGIRSARSYVDGRDAALQLEAMGRLSVEVLDELEVAYQNNDQVYGHVGGQVVDRILRAHGREPVEWRQS